MSDSIKKFLSNKYWIWKLWNELDSISSSDLFIDQNVGEIFKNDETNYIVSVFSKNWKYWLIREDWKILINGLDFIGELKNSNLFIFQNELKYGILWINWNIIVQWFSHIKETDEGFLIFERNSRYGLCWKDWNIIKDNLDYVLWINNWIAKIRENNIVYEINLNRRSC